jgi:chitodextrinase
MISAQHARELRAIIEGQAASLADETALAVPELFPRWDASESYAVGDRVRHGGYLWRCLTAHVAQATWTPTDSPSLWARVLIPDPEVIPEWVQPDSTNPYMKGDKVTYQGQTWVSIIDNNVWAPDVYGWEVVE